MLPGKFIPKIAVYSLTRDRLDYTKHCFETLKACAGADFDHYVIDNGSTDGTAKWLLDSYKCQHKSLLGENIGISLGSNLALRAIFGSKVAYDVIFKVDNDCEFVQANTLTQMAECIMDVQPLGPKYILSPRVEGINRQPHRGREEQLGGRRIGLTAIVGGLCHGTIPMVYSQYRYPENLPLASKQDDDFCAWLKRNGGQVGYVEGIQVNHYEGTDAQCKRYPEYFERKWQEEKTEPSPFLKARAKDAAFHLAPGAGGE